MRKLLTLSSIALTAQPLIIQAQQEVQAPVIPAPNNAVEDKEAAEMKKVKAAVAQINAMVQNLGNSDYVVREKSQKQLKAWSDKNKTDSILPLKEHYISSQSPEIKARLLKILEHAVKKYNVIVTRGFVGIEMQAVNGSVLIADVRAGTPADKHGLKVGDSITQVDDQDLSKLVAFDEAAMDFFSAYIKGKQAGEEVTLHIKRGNKNLKIKLTLGDYDIFNNTGQKELLKENKFKQWQRKHLPDAE